MRVTEAPYDVTEVVYEASEVQYGPSEMLYDLTEMPYEAFEGSYRLAGTDDDVAGRLDAAAETDKGRTDAPYTSVSVGFDMDDIGCGCKSRKLAIRVMRKHEF